ncbi:MULTISPECIES: dienelactone hydrolase family protein [unclassified Halomonas]|uniref:dienelactone hydrolase family protein n=1 Tax=unclassified Halomonas TaxID=2609666 RepID=UPI0009C26EC0|nr:MULTISPECIES: prolyl oligopeptidase family serine peptidase [unclassified Halomonas]AQU84220.1 hypothetical protein B2G49_17505 [Halomonas sp. 'Soap Lake \
MPKISAERILPSSPTLSIHKTHKQAARKALMRTCSAIAISTACIVIWSSHAQASNFNDERWTLSSGAAGEVVRFQSADPATRHDMIAGNIGESIDLEGQLYLPDGDGPHSVVVFIPGSTGVRPGQDVLHVERLMAHGIGSFVVDPFGPRGLESTVDDQYRLSWAATIYDTFAAYNYLAQRDDVDVESLGAIGFSRGGYAVLQAAMRQFADPILGEGAGFRAIFSAYPWCGSQFRYPNVGDSYLRILMGDQDDWVSPIQCQAYENAIAQHTDRSSMRLVPGAAHSFDRTNQGMIELPDAVKATRFPIMYLNDEGVMFDYRHEEYRQEYADEFPEHIRESKLWDIGASFGSTPELAEEFAQDMETFFVETLKSES